MGNVALRSAMKKTVDKLPDEQLFSAAAFMGYLADQVGAKASVKAINVARMKARMDRAERDIAAGRVIHWRTVRRDV